jgi:hypothetical protein
LHQRTFDLTLEDSGDPRVLLLFYNFGEESWAYLGSYELGNVTVEMPLDVFELRCVPGELVFLHFRVTNGAIHSNSIEIPYHFNAAPGVIADSISPSVFSTNELRNIVVTLTVVGNASHEMDLSVRAEWSVWWNRWVACSPGTIHNYLPQSILSNHLGAGEHMFCILPSDRIEDGVPVCQNYTVLLNQTPVPAQSASPGQTWFVSQSNNRESPSNDDAKPGARVGLIAGIAVGSVAVVAAACVAVVFLCRRP